jgi:predicted nucleic acid-binding protein
MAQQLKRVYIDTNIFIFQLFNVKKPFIQSKVQRFFYDIQNQKLIGVTSSFTRSEYFAVAKELLSELLGKFPDKATLDKALKNFDDFVNQMGIEQFDSDALANMDGKLFADAHIRIDKSVNTYGNFDKKWHGLNGADSLILLFAERSNSQEIATNDDGFKGINSVVKPLIVRERY